MNISPARTSAFDILEKIERERAFSSILLPAYESELSDLDKGLCHEIVLGVLRRKLYLDAVIDQFSSGKKLDLAVRIALQIGLYQILFLHRIPPHSAVNESVDLVQRAKKTSAKGFVNAILRKATREATTLEFSSEIEQLSIETSHPIWLLERWINQFGLEETKALAAANNDIPKHAFRITAKGRKEKIELPEGITASLLVDGCFLSDTMPKSLRELAASGDIYFQDEGSQMVAATIGIPPNGRFLDVCAAPGGKTTMIAERFSGSPNQIVAGDLHEKRVRFLKENCLHQGLTEINFLRYDAENAIPFADEAFDVVLVDAPCSGTGTIRSNPEIRYFLNEDDFSDLRSKQLSILKNASKSLKSGGNLVYSTCSLERDENEAVIREFLKAAPYFRLKRFEAFASFAAEDGTMRTFPHRDQMEGFFIAMLTRD